MELYYGDRVKRKWSGWWLLLYLLSTLVAASLLLSLLAPYIKAEDGWMLWLLPLAGLYAPYIYLLTSIIALIWLIARQWFCIPLLLVMACASLNIDKYYNNPLVNVESVERGVVITTLNCSEVQSSDSLLTTIARYRTDIITLQSVDSQSIEQLLSVNKESSLNRYNLHSHAGLLTMSRYPIVNRDSLDYIAQITDIIFRGDTLRIVNAQLQRSLLTQKEYDDERFALWVGEYGERARERSIHSERIDSLVSASPYRLILTVAMEDVAQSYTYNTLTNNLGDSYCRSEYISSANNNYTRGREQHRLEYIMYSDGLEPTRYTDQECGSHHRAVAVRLRVSRRNSEINQ